MITQGKLFIFSAIFIRIDQALVDRGMRATSAIASHRRLIKVLPDLSEYVPQGRELVVDRRLVDTTLVLVVGR